jgi:hypothetical protein
MCIYISMYICEYIHIYIYIYIYINIGDGLNLVTFIGRNFRDTDANFCKFRACLSANNERSPHRCRNQIQASGIYMCIYMYVYMYTYMYISACIYICIHVYVYMYVMYI